LLARIEFKRGNDEQAKSYVEEYLKGMHINFAILSASHLDVTTRLAEECVIRGLFDYAERLLDVSYSIGMGQPFHPDSLETLNCYEKLLVLTDRKDEVADMRSWLRRNDQILIV
jgi:hypothetical protein